jgi:RNA polymerase sigma-70 factor (ECF subfamily)
MDCPAGTVMSRLYRGRKILQGLLREYAVEQGIIDGSSPVAAEADGASEGAQPVDIAAYRRTRERDAKRKGEGS